MALQHSVQRPLAHAGKRFALGVLIQGGVASEGHFPVWDLARLRVFGVLQRIAVCSLFASLLVLYVPECQLPKLEVRYSPSSSWLMALSVAQLHAMLEFTSMVSPQLSEYASDLISQCKQARS